MFDPAALIAALAMSAGAEPAQSQNIVVPAEHVEWATPTLGGPRLGKLWGDRATGAAGTLLNVPGGWIAPVHNHTASYRAVVVAGLWKHWPQDGRKATAQTLRPGSFWTQAASEWHSDACVSKTPCTIFMLNDDPFRTILKK